MIRLWTTRALACLALATTAACGGDSAGPGAGNGALTARIDGEAFSSQFTSVQRPTGSVYVNAGGVGARAIGFVFPDTGPGTYVWATGAGVSAGVSIGASHYGPVGGSVTINVTTFTDSRLAGTFTMTLTAIGGQSSATVTVTEGKFDINY